MSSRSCFRHPARNRRLLAISLVSLGTLLGWRASAADKTDEAAHHHHDHHRHHAVKVDAPVKRSQADYRIPALKMTRNDGTTAAFPAEIDDGRPVILNFIYTSCTTVCPLTSQVFSQVQKKLGKQLHKIHMMSISIDPEYDTPARLSAYAGKFQSSPQWQHYTGTIEASVALQKAFDAYRGDKMNHVPLTLMRAAPGKAWVRLEGFATPDDVVREFHGLAGSQ